MWGEVLRGSTSTSALSLTITHQRRWRRSVPWASKTWTCHLGGFKPLLLLTPIYYTRMMDLNSHKHDIVVWYCPDICILINSLSSCASYGHMTATWRGSQTPASNTYLLPLHLLASHPTRDWNLPRLPNAHHALARQYNFSRKCKNSKVIAGIHILQIYNISWVRCLASSGRKLTKEVQKPNW